MAYDARTVANEFLRLAKDSGRTLTNMQLQKLVYIAHGYLLAIHEDDLITQNVQAWRYGPVIPILYHSLSEYGSGVVSKPIATAFRESISERDKILIEKVFAAYGRYSGPQLSTMTHRDGTPWREVFDPHPYYANEVIPNRLIKEHYRKLLHEQAGIAVR